MNKKCHCGKDAICKGLCHLHYVTYNRYGRDNRKTKKHKDYPATLRNVGKYHYAYFIKKAKQKIEYKCICGKNNNLVLHHIDGNSENNNPRNWMFLCYSCHKVIHIYGKILTKNELKVISIKNRKRYYRNIVRPRLERNAIKNNIPIGYIKTSEAINMLKVSRERIRQIKYMFKYIEVNLKPNAKRPVRFWLKKSIEKYIKNKS